MSDPTEMTQPDPHPVSGHRTPSEIAMDEAGPIGQQGGHVVSGGSLADFLKESMLPPLPKNRVRLGSRSDTGH